MHRTADLTFATELDFNERDRIRDQDIVEGANGDNTARPDPTDTDWEDWPFFEPPPGEEAVNTSHAGQEYEIVRGILENAKEKKCVRSLHV